MFLQLRHPFSLAESHLLDSQLQNHFLRKSRTQSFNASFLLWLIYDFQVIERQYLFTLKMTFVILLRLDFYVEVTVKRRTRGKEIEWHSHSLILNFTLK